ncbi:hypothetical protein ACIA5C_47890 [Actinoplanes sp. NPDC051343]|uniref:hypothetical protein n=1 Tax=Actinoplanes sp. NPDC051343 TaxID=3363906 RepID=UPI0037A68092
MSDHPMDTAPRKIRSIVDRDLLIRLIEAYGDARENARGAAGIFSEIVAALDADTDLDTLSEAVNDAYAYRLGDADGLDDPDLEPIDAEYASKYGDLASRFGIRLSA